MDLIARFSSQAAFVNTEIVPWVLRLVMIGLGLSLTIADFRRVVVFPKAAAIGLVAQLAGLPLAAFGLALVFGAPAPIAIGLVILAACPSGVTANAYTFAARADVPLCVTLSALTSVITVFTIPWLIGIALAVFADPGQTVAVSATTMLGNLMKLTVIPLVIGMALRLFFPDAAAKAVEPIRKAVLVLMVVVLGLGVVSSIEQIADNFATAGLLVIVMNLLTMGLGFGVARAFRLPTTQVVTITFEVGVQNLALALAIAFNILQRPELAIAALIYSAVMPATALAFVSVGRRLIAADTKAAS
jgi:BASS family bile acid:Na+ symporter